MSSTKVDPLEDLRRWAILDEDPFDEWDRGYSAARRYVRMQLAAAPSAQAEPFCECAAKGLSGCSQFEVCEAAGCEPKAPTAQAEPQVPVQPGPINR